MARILVEGSASRPAVTVKSLKPGWYKEKNHGVFCIIGASVSNPRLITVFQLVERVYNVGFHSTAWHEDNLIDSPTPLTMTGVSFTTN